MPNVTMFERFSSIREPKVVKIELVLDGIKTGRWKDKVESIRATDDSEELRVLKMGLPCVCYAGEFTIPVEITKDGNSYFSCRTDQSLSKHSGLVPIDIDDVDNIDDIFQTLKEDQFIYAVWRSASGRGIHGLVRIGDGNKHRLHYQALIQKYKFLDTTARNESRLLFVSYDPDIYINSKSSIFYDIAYEEEEDKDKKISFGDGYTDYKKIDTACKMVRMSYEGEKHNTLLKAAVLLGGYVASGRVEKVIAEELLWHEISKRNIQDPISARDTIKDGILFGMTKPLDETEANFQSAATEVAMHEGSLDFLSVNAEDEDYIRRFKDGLIPLGLPLGHEELDEYLLLKEGEFYGVLAHSSIGKAQPLSSGVLTPSGWKTMGEIKLFDEVVGMDGKPQKVLGVFPQGERPVYKVTLADGAFVFCDEEHLWSVNGYYTRHKGKKIDGINRYAPDDSFSIMKTSDMIKSVKVGKGKRAGCRNYKLPSISPVEFSHQDVDIDPYTLGVLIGDGSMSKTIRVSTKDDDIISHLSTDKYFVSYHKRTRVVGGKDRWVYDVTMSYKIKEELSKLGLLFKHSEHKFVPDIYKYNSVDVRIAVLQGLLDTDGTVSRIGSVSFTTSSETLAYDVIELVQSLGGRAVKSKKYKKYTYKGERKNGLPSYDLQINLPEGIKPFRMQRHLTKIRTNRTKNFRYIDKIEYSHQEECQCIMVSNPDQMYITDGYIPTHNTSLTLWLIFLSAVRYDWNWFVYTGENKSSAVKMKLIEFYCGRKIRHIPNHWLKEAVKWVNDHFFIAKTDKTYEYKELVGFAETLSKYKSLKGVFIDPYNSLKAETSLSKSKYQYDYEAYSDMLAFTSRTKTTLILSVHTNTEAQRIRDKDGNPVMPFASMAEGGVALLNKVDNFLVYNRKTKDPMEWMYTEISVDKVRNQETGGKPTSRNAPIRLRMNGAVEFVDESGVLPITRDYLPKYE